MKILIDMDGIVADLLGKWLRVYNEEHGTDLHRDHVHVFDMNEAFPGHSKLVSIIFRDGFFDDLEVIPGSQEGVEKLREAGHTIRFATSVCSEDSARAKLVWLKKHFDVSSKHVHLCEEKWEISGHVLIDDKPETIVRWRETERLALGLEYPYNRHLKRTERKGHLYSDIARDWPHLLEFLL